MRKWLAFILVLAVTLFVRIYGAASESVWYDEAVTVCQLDQPTLGEFLDADREVDKLKVPLYFVIEYAWWHVFGPYVLGLRMLSIVFAMATAGTLYWCSERTWGEWTALAASLYFALSKYFIYFGQEIRMYSLMYLLAVVSWFALYAAVRGKRGAWAIHAVSNLLLIQTHLLGVLSFAAQFIFLVFDGPKNWRRLAAWAGAHVLIVASIVPWVMQFTNYDRAIEWIPLPTALTLLNTFVFIYAGVKPSDMYPLPITPVWIAVGIVLIAIPALVFGIRAMWRADLRAAKLLLCWLILPPMLMFVASYVLRPSYVDRYALYAAVPFFIFAGYGIASLRPRGRSVASALLAVLCVANVYAIDRPVRPDLAGAADIIRFNRQPDDRIVTRGMGYEFCMRVYLADARASEVPLRVPIRRSVKDAVRGQRTWFVFAAIDTDYARWKIPIDEAVEAGEVSIRVDEYTGGKNAVRVVLLAPAGAR